ncbi:MAG: cytochrome c3 family protein [Candidatus Solibacter usitatus]|nr:cytochrome c3 family protein [Candidatus Solibacter usitatus]
MSVLLIALALSASVLRGAEDNTAPCMDCHAGNAQSKRGGTEIDPARFARATHSFLGCTGCHLDGFSAYPHKATRKDALDCMTCHAGDSSAPYNRAQIEADLNKSVHIFVADPNFKCTYCHWPHDFLPVRKMKSIAEAVEIGNKVCMECHATPKHTWIPMWELHTKAARCVDCHTAGKEETIHHILPASRAQRDCVNCHSRDSLLLRKLYKHIAARQRSQEGMVNAVIFNNAYMIGATKFEWLDRISILLFGMTVAAVFVHGAGRRLARGRKKR